MLSIQVEVSPRRDVTDLCIMAERSFDNLILAIVRAVCSAVDVVGHQDETGRQLDLQMVEHGILFGTRASRMAVRTLQ